MPGQFAAPRTPTAWAGLAKAALAAAAALLFISLFGGPSVHRVCVVAGRGAIECRAEMETPAPSCLKEGRGPRICPAQPS